MEQSWLWMNIDCRSGLGQKKAPAEAGAKCRERRSEIYINPSLTKTQYPILTLTIDQ